MERGEEYQKWIREYGARANGHVRGKCRQAVGSMTQAFPELRKAAGFVHCSWGREQHWWCVAPDGSIVDPTAAQFEVIFEYEELDLDDPETRKIVPTGRCMDCGDDVYEGSTFCNDACANRTSEYMNSIIRGDR